MQSGRCLPLRSSLGTNRRASLLNEQRLLGFAVLALVSLVLVAAVNT
jgi:hypothetical protein